jgi:hypothetical protein
MKEKKFVCQTCESRFSSLKDLKRHEAAVHEAKPFRASKDKKAEASSM